jgi:hypothetical protein
VDCLWLWSHCTQRQFVLKHVITYGFRLMEQRINISFKIFLIIFAYIISNSSTPYFRIKLFAYESFYTFEMIRPIVRTPPYTGIHPCPNWNSNSWSQCENKHNLSALQTAWSLLLAMICLFVQSIMGFVQIYSLPHIQMRDMLSHSISRWLKDINHRFDNRQS